MESLFDPAALRPFVEVMLINIVLSGDNAIVVGMAAAPAEIRQKRKWLASHTAARAAAVLSSHASTAN